MNHLIIVESPAKAKTIKKFLGAKYNVKASMGHIRDLPKKNLAIDVENNFEPDYEISPDKKKIVQELKAVIKKAPDTLVWLATDEDREGESIAWHLMHALNLHKDNYKRIAFHEITKSAILGALDNPRILDYNLVHAQQARRVLDRLVGYKLSPLLWKKVQAGLSAGRVQSVAVRLIVEREREVEAFKPEEYWKIFCDLNAEKGEFRADLAKIKGKKAVVGNKKTADKILEDLHKSEYIIDKVVKKTSKRQPAPPFITSTLQQEASRKLGFSVRQTMVIAQQLYEGIAHGDEHAGLITYMRTDSYNLSNEFLKNAPKVIDDLYGKKYVLDKPRVFTKKARGAQEAHEAIRPTLLDKTPKDLKPHLDTQQYKLYKLIWERTIASQMKEALVDVTNVEIKAGDYLLGVKGQIIKEHGFMKAYIEGKDHPEDNSDEEYQLPDLTEGETCKLKKITPEQKFTQPPHRYTEATLVKKMEAEGIGRPSTYAPTISTIIHRGYIDKRKDKKLYPMDIGMLVNDFLVEHFPEITDYQFTAKLEDTLDDIADGKKKWQPVIEEFYTPFIKLVEDATENAKRVTGEKELGTDPKSGRPVIARIGRYGPMVQIGTKDDEDKPKFAKLQEGQHINTITLKEAMELFKLPRTIGELEEKEVVVSIGRFGPYIRHDNKFYSLPKEDDPYHVKLDRALVIIEKKREEEKNKVINVFFKGDIQVLNGRYGPYISADGSNYKIPKDKDAHALTLDDCQEIIKTTKPSGRGFKKKKKK